MPKIPLHSSRPLRLTFLLGVLLPFLLTACATSQTSIRPGPTPTTFLPSPTAPEPAPPAVPTAPSPSLRPPPTSTPIPTAQPSPTAPPAPLTLAVPATWETAVRAALTDPSLQNWAWQLVVTEETAAAAADLQLVPSADGIPVAASPLALAVPLTLPWESVTQAQAQELVTQGHEQVQIMLWHDLEPSQKSLRVDGRLPHEPGYPLQQYWSLLAEPAAQQAATVLAALLPDQPPDPVVHLAAVGDLMLDRSLGWYLQQGEVDYPFAEVVDLLTAPDLTVGNLESALGDTGIPAAKSYTFRAPPQAAVSLARAGFDLVTLANNHTGDFGLDALLQAMELLHGEDIATVGAGAGDAEAHAPYVTTVNGLTLAFLGYVHVPVEAIGSFDTASWTATETTPGLAWADPARVAADVTAVASQVDLVIVLLHSGYEYVDAPSPPQVSASRAAIDAGAHLVIGHHAHILQGIEYYGDGVIVYGLGNFAFEIDGPPETAVLNVWLDGDGVRTLELVPAVIQFGGQPRLATPAEAAAIRQRVYFLTDALNPEKRN